MTTESDKSILERVGLMLDGKSTHFTKEELELVLKFIPGMKKATPCDWEPKLKKECGGEDYIAEVQSVLSTSAEIRSHMDAALTEYLPYEKSIGHLVCALDRILFRLEMIEKKLPE